MLPQQYCLRWKHHHSNVQSMFSELLEKERFCDVTLYCSSSFLQNDEEVEPEMYKGVSLRAHRVVLASCSELLAGLLAQHESQGEPVIVMDGAEPGHVKALLDYMYTGEMNVHRSELDKLLKTAEELKIKGLTDIPWHNKEPPDCMPGAETTVETKSHYVTCTTDDRQTQDMYASEEARRETVEKVQTSINGGPPPLIKLPLKEKCSPPLKRDSFVENDDVDLTLAKRARHSSGMDHTDDEDRDTEWRHGNMDISAEKVSQWSEASCGSWPAEEWEAPADIGSFLHTRLKVDGDISGEDSNEPTSISPSTSATDLSTKGDLAKITPVLKSSSSSKPPIGPKSGPSDPRFTDVVKLNDYLRHGRRPQFWEEDYVKRVMEAIRLKELEMKQAAEILGVSYGTLYGRYRDAYGCINRPFRNAREFWTTKGTAEMLDRLKRGELTADLAAHLRASRDIYPAGSEPVVEKEFDPIPIEIDPSLRVKPNAPFAPGLSVTKSVKKMPPVKKVLVGNIHDDESIPATVITAQECKRLASIAAQSARIWRSTPLDLHRPSSSSSPDHNPTSPTDLMKSRPDLTIVAAKKPDCKKDDEKVAGSNLV